MRVCVRAIAGWKMEIIIGILVELSETDYVLFITLSFKII